MEHTSGWLVDQVTRQPELLSVNFADRCQKISDPSCPATDADSKAPGCKEQNSRDDPPEVVEHDETQSVWRGHPRETKRSQVRMLTTRIRMCDI